MHYQPKCQHRKRAHELCVGLQCTVKNCFVCVECKQSHPKTCRFMQYKKFVHEIHKRQGLTKPNLISFQERIEKTFQVLIKSLKKQFIRFRQEFQSFQAPDQVNKFYYLIKNSKENILTGDFTNSLLDFKSTKEQFELKTEVHMLQTQSLIFEAQSYILKNLPLYYTLNDKFKDVVIQAPEHITELKQIERKFINSKYNMKGLLNGELKYVQQMLGKSIYSINLKFKASEHGFSCRKFHQICDQKMNFLVVAKTEFNKTVCCWCPFIWDSPSTWEYIESPGSFMFSMEKSLRGRKFVPLKKQFAIGMHKDYGPIFGDDFVIYDKAHQSNSCWSNFPDVYNCKPNALPHEVEILKEFVGVSDHFKKFNLLEWEAYHIGFSQFEDVNKEWLKIYNEI